MSIIKSIQGFAGTKAETMQAGMMMPGEYRGAMGESFLVGGQGPLKLFTYDNFGSALKAYTKCPPVSAIINKKAQAYINGKTFIMDRGKKKKESVSIFSNKLRKLMAKPNPLQSWKQFEAQNYIYQQIFGWCLVLPIIPFGFKDRADATALWNIPGNMIEPKMTGKIWYQTELGGIIDKIILTYGGERTELPLEKVFIFRDFTPSFSSMVFPESRICALEWPINNIMGALESRNVLINYRGALGIISNEGKDASGPIPLKDPEKKDLQKDFLRYGLKGQQWKFIITSANVKWQSMGVPTKDLMLFEEVVENTMTCCDGYGFPYPLMSSARTNSLGGSNTDPNKAMLYQDTIIPEAESMYDHWNDFFDTAANGCEMQKDYGHIPVLQDDKAASAEARATLGAELLQEFKNNLITYNRVLELLDEDQISGMDKYYRELLEAGWVFGENATPPADPNTRVVEDTNKAVKKVLTQISLLADRIAV